MRVRNTSCYEVAWESGSVLQINTGWGARLSRLRILSLGPPKRGPMHSAVAHLRKIEKKEEFLTKLKKRNKLPS